MKKIIAFLLILACVGGLATACGEIASDITSSVLEAAKKELETQVKEKVAEYKVAVVEMKTAFGDINESSAENQFYCAVLIKTDSEESASTCSGALGKVFGKSGFEKQTSNKVESEFLTKQTITYNHADYEGGNYYTVYVYVEDITKVVDMEAIKDKLSDVAASIGK
jgi:hypothetical protein